MASRDGLTSGSYEVLAKGRSGPRGKNLPTSGIPKATSKRWYSLSVVYAIHSGRHGLHKKIPKKKVKQEKPDHTTCNFRFGRYRLVGQKFKSSLSYINSKVSLGFVRFCPKKFK